MLIILAPFLLPFYFSSTMQIDFQSFCRFGQSDRQMDRWTRGKTNRRKDRQMERQRDVWTNGEIDIWRDGHVDGHLDSERKRERGRGKGRVKER
jgi:hypothetical protein